MILDSEVYRLFLEETEERLYQAWETSHEDDKEGREKIYRAHKMLKALDSHFKGYIAGEQIKKSYEFFG